MEMDDHMTNLNVVGDLDVGTSVTAFMSELTP
jgi:hypothetical protein